MSCETHLLFEWLYSFKPGRSYAIKDGHLYLWDSFGTVFSRGETITGGSFKNMNLRALKAQLHVEELSIKVVALSVKWEPQGNQSGRCS